MRWRIILGGLVLTISSAFAFVLVFAPPVPARKNYAAVIDIVCPPTKKPLAVLDVIPDPPAYLSFYADVNVAIDHNRDCSMLRLSVHRDVSVAILNTDMIGDPIKGPEPSERPSKPIDYLQPSATTTNGFVQYIIDLDKLGKDRWIGLGSMASAVRSSLENFDADLGFRLSEGQWEVLDAAPGPLQRDGGPGGNVWNVTQDEALSRTFHYTVSYRNTAMVPYRELAIILFGAFVTAGLGITANGFWAGFKKRSS